jgi:hypothetical protein
MKLSAQTQKVLADLFAALDYSTLGEIYCHEGGEDFWQDRRGPALELGCQWAEALATRIPSSGRSLYVGAGVAELPALVMEVMDLQRQVRIVNRDQQQCESLNQSLQAVGLAQSIQFEAMEALAVKLDQNHDHLSMVSILNDPETYPVISGVAYGRIPPVTLDVEAFLAERAKVHALIAHCLQAVSLPCWLTCTFEEVPWIMYEAAQRGWQCVADDEMLEAAIVGDPIGFLRLSPEDNL